MEVRRGVVRDSFPGRRRSLVRSRGESPGRVRKEPDPSLTTGGAKKTVHAAEEAGRDGFFPVTAANLFLTLQERGHQFPSLPLPTTGPVRLKLRTNHI